MSSDPIVDEIRAIREKIAASHDYDIDALLQSAKERDAQGDRKVVSRPPRRPLEETVYLLQTPANAKRLLSAQEALESGQGAVRSIELGE